MPPRTKVIPHFTTEQACLKLSSRRCGRPVSAGGGDDDRLEQQQLMFLRANWVAVVS